MKVLVVCSFNRNRIAPFIAEQVVTLQMKGIITEYFHIKGKGKAGYIRNLNDLNRKIRSFQPDLIHAHYGLSGLLSVLQNKIPVIITLHGSDLNLPWVRLLSKMAIKHAAWSIFVSQRLANLTGKKDYYSIIPCGIDLQTFFPVDKSEARQKTGFAQEDKLVLFSGSFTTGVKNFPLANDSVTHLNNNNPTIFPVKLIELKGYSRDEVNLLINAADVILLTSLWEGSPNVIKEAMACNRPVVSTDVGDVRTLTEGIPGCFIAQSNPADVADKIRQALQYEHSIGARQRIIDRGLEINETARKIVRVYEEVLEKEKRLKK